MKRLFLYIFFLVNLSLNAQKNYTLSGYVLDSQSNELIIGSSVIVEGLNIGTITNSYGFFSITIEKGNYNIRIQNLGFKDNTQNINLLIL